MMILFFLNKNLLLYNKLPQNSADSNSCFILKVRDSGRAQLGGLSLICCQLRWLELEDLGFPESFFTPASGAWAGMADGRCWLLAGAWLGAVGS